MSVSIRITKIKVSSENKSNIVKALAINAFYIPNQPHFPHRKTHTQTHTPTHPPLYNQKSIATFVTLKCALQPSIFISPLLGDMHTSGEKTFFFLNAI